jgi:hypothetical protein
MPLAVRLSRWFVPVVFAGLSSSGCMGRADLGAGEGSDDGPPATGSSSGSSSGGSTGSSSGPASSSSSSGGPAGSSSGGSSGSSSGGSTGSSSGPASSSSSSGGPSPGDPDCSDLAVPDLARVCPDGSTVGGQYIVSNHECVLEFPCPTAPPNDGCTQGAPCSLGSGCGTASSGTPGDPGCETSCMCDGTGHLQCTVTCNAPTGCAQGAPCMPGTACANASAPGQCSSGCTCGPDGTFDCSVCDDAGSPPVTDPCPGFAVPDICEVCSNGTTECAHAILADGECQIEICPGG